LIVCVTMTSSLTSAASNVAPTGAGGDAEPSGGATAASETALSWRAAAGGSTAPPAADAAAAAVAAGAGWHSWVHLGTAVWFRLCVRVEAVAAAGLGWLDWGGDAADGAGDAADAADVGFVGAVPPQVVASETASVASEMPAACCAEELGGVCVRVEAARGGWCAGLCVGGVGVAAEVIVGTPVGTTVVR
jgi:hypothetical protein